MVIVYLLHCINDSLSLERFSIGGQVDGGSVIAPRAQQPETVSISVPEAAAAAATPTTIPPNAAAGGFPDPNNCSASSKAQCPVGCYKSTDRCMGNAEWLSLEAGGSEQRRGIGSWTGQPDPRDDFVAWIRSANLTDAQMFQIDEGDCRAVPEGALRSVCER